MKERIQKIIIALIFLLGLSIVLVLMEYFLPSWVNYSLGGLLLVWWLYDVSKPEKKDGHYWCYTFMSSTDKISLGYGVQLSKGTEFDFESFYKKYPKYVLIMVKEVSKSQYEEMNDLINKNKQKESYD